jgi:serine/threonine protein kinase
VTLFNLVTGCLPFEADNIYLLFQTIGTGIYTIPDDIEPHLASLLNGLLHIDKSSRFTIEQIKQHDWFRRRPPRTFDYLPFPPAALNRFQTFTMYDYLSELHQAPTETSDEQQQQDIHVPDGSISVINSPYDNQPENNVNNESPRRRGRSALNCACSRTISSDNIHQTKGRSRQHHRMCSLS